MVSPPCLLASVPVDARGCQPDRVSPPRLIRHRPVRRDHRSDQVLCRLRSESVIVIVVGNYFCCRFLRGQRRLDLQPRLPHPRRNHCAPKGLSTERKTGAPNTSAFDCDVTIGILLSPVKSTPIPCRRIVLNLSLSAEGASGPSVDTCPLISAVAIRKAPSSPNDCRSPVWIAGCFTATDIATHAGAKQHTTHSVGSTVSYSHSRSGRRGRKKNVAGENFS